MHFSLEFWITAILVLLGGCTGKIQGYNCGNIPSKIGKFLEEDQHALLTSPHYDKGTTNQY